MGSIVESVLREVQLYHVVHALTLLWYPVARLYAPARALVFPEAPPSLTSEEAQTLSMLGIYLAIRARRAGSFDAFVGHVFFASKAALCVILLRENVAMAIFYLAICTVLSFVLPAPAADADSGVIAVNGPRLQNLLQGRGQGGKVQYTVVEFYTTWSSACNFVARDYASIAKRYSSPHMKFLKVNASTYPAIAKEHGIRVDVQSPQLPTFILFADGEEVDRRPRVFSNNRVERCKINEAYLEEAFSLVVRSTGKRTAEIQQQQSDKDKDKDKDKEGSQKQRAEETKKDQ